MLWNIFDKMFKDWKIKSYKKVECVDIQIKKAIPNPDSLL